MLLRARGRTVAGFVQQDVPDGHGETAGWDVVSVSDPSRCSALARVSDAPNLCGYAFSEAGFAYARQLATDEADVVIVGGVGKLEAAKQGHWPLIEELLSGPSTRHVVLCIRDSCLSTVALALPDPFDHVSLPCDDAELERLADAVARRG